MDKYLDRLAEIRVVQQHLVELAIKEGIPVVENANVDRTIDEVVELVLLAADRVHETA
jgi:2-phosphoglycerate kinase